MWIIAASMVGFLIDCVVGDPIRLPHPVRFIGWWISKLEQWTRRVLPQTPLGEQTAGIIMAAAVLAITGGTAWSVLWLLGRVNCWLAFAASCILCWQVLAAKCLKSEAVKVQCLLEQNDLPGARRQIAMLVGRDTQNLDGRQVAKAAIETVAENTGDGVVAPLFWLLLGGPVAGLLYKAVNTMDSMVGYKNQRFLHFGRWPARLDDAVNYLPARLTALAMVAAAFLLKLDGREAWRIWRRDRRKHASPNSAHPESACAGALNLQLAGNASYFGKVQQKPFIGDDIRPVEAGDIGKACRLMYGASLLALGVFSLVRLACMLI